MSLFDKLLRRRSHYRQTFGSQSGLEVLADLKRFCRATQSSVIVSNGRIDSHAMAVAEGRREVFLRILNHIHMDDGQLIRLKETAGDD